MNNLNDTENSISIDEGFPYSLNQQELVDKICELNREIVITKQINLAHKYSALSQIALLELNSRQLKEQVDSNKRTTYISVALAILATFVSGVSAFFAYRDDSADSIWQKEQIEILKSSDSLLKNIDSFININIPVNNERKREKKKEAKAK